MKVAVTIAALNPEHGGPPRTVPALCRALSSSSVKVELITIAENKRGGEMSEGNSFVATVIPAESDRYHPRSWRAAFKNATRRALHGRNDTVLYDVGLWLPSNHFAAQIAAETQRPFVISPRGMLSQEALAMSKWRKLVAWNLYQRRDLKSARVLHATSEDEARDFRRHDLSQPIAIIPNGVDLPSISRTAPNGKVRTLLFLSRLHPIKGLKDLVVAWAKARPRDWRVILAGPNENNHQREIESLAESFGVRADFEFAGPVDDREKWRLLAAADLFTLPSYSESFGLAIAEALAAGLPVITTRATPWRELETHRCGWWIEPGADSLAAALSLATNCNREELQRMGERGHELIHRNYSWEGVATKFVRVFAWLLGREERPPWLI